MLHKIKIAVINKLNLKLAKYISIHIKKEIIRYGKAILYKKPITGKLITNLEKYFIDTLINNKQQHAI